MKLAKIGKPALWRSLAVASGIALTLSVGGTVVTNEWSGYINKYLGISNTKIVTADSNTEDPIHFKSEYDSYTDVMNYARATAKQVQAEGTVLMTNKNNALPLSKGANVTFLSYATADIALGSSGSGGITPTAERLQDLVKACTNDGKLNINKTVYDFYKAKYDAKVGFVEKQGWGGTSLVFRDIKKPTELAASEFTTAVTDSFADFADAGIFVLSRIGGEGSDLSVQDRYLALSNEEKSVLEAMKNGPFKKRIVLVNTFNTPELGFLDEYNIDACLYIGGPGEMGMDAVTDILVGKTVPSGKLADTYAYDSTSSPAMQISEILLLPMPPISSTPIRASSLCITKVFTSGTVITKRVTRTRYSGGTTHRPMRARLSTLRGITVRKYSSRSAMVSRMRRSRRK